MNYSMGNHLHCIDCGERLPAGQVKFCCLTCKITNRNARRRKKYADGKKRL